MVQVWIWPQALQRKERGPLTAANSVARIRWPVATGPSLASQMNITGSTYCVRIVVIPEVYPKNASGGDLLSVSYRYAFDGARHGLLVVLNPRRRSSIRLQCASPVRKDVMSKPVLPSRYISAPLTDPRSTGAGPRPTLPNILGLRGTLRR